MIGVFISIGPIHKRQATIKPRKLLNNVAVWSGEGAVLMAWPLPSKYAIATEDIFCRHSACRIPVDTQEQRHDTWNFCGKTYN